MVLPKIISLGVKTNRNSIIFDLDPHIVDRLFITVPHMNVYGFSKISNFHSKFIGISLRFYMESPVFGKN
jgi:hypothetical protein